MVQPSVYGMIFQGEIPRKAILKISVITDVPRFLLTLITKSTEHNTASESITHWNWIHINSGLYGYAFIPEEKQYSLYKSHVMGILLL